MQEGACLPACLPRPTQPVNPNSLAALSRPPPLPMQEQLLSDFGGLSEKVRLDIMELHEKVR